MAGPAEAGGSQSKGQDRNELHERQKWRKARSVSAHRLPSAAPLHTTTGNYLSCWLPVLSVPSHPCGEGRGTVGSVGMDPGQRCHSLTVARHQAQWGCSSPFLRGFHGLCAVEFPVSFATSQFLCLCSPSFLAEVSPCAVVERTHVGEHWGTTCSVLIPLSPSARGLESLQPLELGLKALLGSQGFTSDPGRGSFLLGKRAGKHKRSYCPVTTAIAGHGAVSGTCCFSLGRGLGRGVHLWFSSVWYSRESAGFALSINIKW